MEFFQKVFNLLRHLGDDVAWREMIAYVGGVPTLYTLLFGIVFCETGLVIIPFLPGDSLLFAIGAMSARDIGIEVWFIGPLLVIAALLGDNVNYWLGRKMGPKIFRRDDAPSARPSNDPAHPKRSIRSRLLNRKHLDQSHAFFEKYGPKTVILARFVPIVRTFAPFVAGIAAMNYARFLVYSVIGAVFWVSICMTAGYYFGGFEFVKKRFELVVLAIIFISVLPMAFEFFKARREGCM